MRRPSTWNSRARASALVGYWITTIAAAFLLPRLPQPASYHAFHETRVLLGVPHFGDVVSNLAFLIVGAVGLWALASGRLADRFTRDWEMRPYVAFFGGLVLVAFGSAYYHWAPSNETLFWDRAAMTVAFMSLASIVIADRVDQGWGVRRGLPLLVALGVGSAIAWRLTDDVTYYFVIAQVAPMGSLLLMVFVLYPKGRTTDTRWLLGLAGLYGLAVTLENLDGPIWALTDGVISGHTLKHLFAAASVGLVIPMLASRPKRRVPELISTSASDDDEVAVGAVAA